MAKEPKNPAAPAPKKPAAPNTPAQWTKEMTKEIENTAARDPKGPSKADLAKEAEAARAQSEGEGYLQGDGEEAV